MHINWYILPAVICTICTKKPGLHAAHTARDRVVGRVCKYDRRKPVQQYTAHEIPAVSCFMQYAGITTLPAHEKGERKRLSR